MKNITVSLPDDLARKTRILAAETDTSMSRYLATLIAKQVTEESSYRAAMDRYLSRPRGGNRADDSPLPGRDSLHDRDALR